MKSIILISLFYIIAASTYQYSQDIISSLAGHDSTNGFTVVDDEGNVLFRITGNGNVGINTNSPSGIFDVNGGTSTTGNGRNINIVAEDGGNGENPGGNILLKTGNASYYGDPAVIHMNGGVPDGYGGGINIYSGHGGEFGGNINIISSVGGLLPDNFVGNPLIRKDTKRMNTLSNTKVGDINIGTDPFSNLYGGKIRIYTGEDNAGGGDIEISTGISSGDGNKITLQTGASSGGNGDIVLKSEVGGTNGGDIILTPNPTGGSVIINGSGIYSGTWSQNSDIRFKKNIESLSNSLEKIQMLKGVSYDFKNEEFPGKNFSEGKQIGLIAQNVEEIFPELVNTDSEGYKSVAYQNMVAVLIEAIKEQQKNIEELKNEVELLKNKMNVKNSGLSVLEK